MGLICGATNPNRDQHLKVDMIPWFPVSKTPGISGYSMEIDGGPFHYSEVVMLTKKKQKSTSNASQNGKFKCYLSLRANL
ncbi:hypothetical protein L1987_09453 [Smallanthus sonchifolius]|uniref:Uncharacterized protein n=1 Tax=Smallanthus sonchifolius TaxID=185202 RepID=A0ACB9JP97_9ASTR|nr:hypothetical protein L1987_09453 [Smallanthus sonchifolius]